MRLDQPLAQEIRRIAVDRGSTESEVARLLLSYGVEVQRRLDSQRFSRSYESEYGERDEPGVVEIQAQWVPVSEGEGGS